MTAQSRWCRVAVLECILGVLLLAAGHPGNSLGDASSSSNMNGGGMIPQRKWLPVSDFRKMNVTHLSDYTEVGVVIKDMHFDSHNNVMYLAFHKLNTPTANRYSLTSNGYTGQWSPTSSIQYIQGITTNSDGSMVYVAGIGGLSLRQFDPSSSSSSMTALVGYGGFTHGAQGTFGAGYGVRHFQGFLYGIAQSSDTFGSCLYSFNISSNYLEKLAFDCTNFNGQVEGAPASAQANKLRSLSLAPDGSWIFLVQEYGGLWKVSRSSGWAFKVRFDINQFGHSGIQHHPVFDGTAFLALSLDLGVYQDSGVSTVLAQSPALTTGSTDCLLGDGCLLSPRAIVYDPSIGALYVGSDQSKTRLSKICCLFEHKQEVVQQQQGAGGTGVSEDSVNWYDYTRYEQTPHLHVESAAVMKSGAGAVQNIGNFLYNPRFSEYYSTQVGLNTPALMKISAADLLRTGKLWTTAAFLPMSSVGTVERLALGLSPDGSKIFLSWALSSYLREAPLGGTALSTSRIAGTGSDTWNDGGKAFSGFSELVVSNLGTDQTVVGTDTYNGMILSMELQATSTPTVVQVACLQQTGTQLRVDGDRLLAAKCQAPFAISQKPDGSYLFVEKWGRLRTVTVSYVTTLGNPVAGSLLTDLLVHPWFHESYVLFFTSSLRFWWDGAQTSPYMSDDTAGSWAGSGPLSESMVLPSGSGSAEFKEVRLLEDTGEILIAKAYRIVKICCLFYQLGKDTTVRSRKDLGKMEVDTLWSDGGHNSTILEPSYAALHGHVLYYNSTLQAMAYIPVDGTGLVVGGPQFQGPQHFPGSRSVRSFVVTPDEKNIFYGVAYEIVRQTYGGDISTAVSTWGTGSLGVLNAGTNEIWAPGPMFIQGSRLYLMDTHSHCIGSMSHTYGNQKTIWACFCNTGFGHHRTDGLALTARCYYPRSMSPTQDERVTYIGERDGSIRKMDGVYITTCRLGNYSYPTSLLSLLPHPVFEDVFLWTSSTPHVLGGGGLHIFEGQRERSYQPLPGVLLEDGSWSAANSLAKGLGLNTKTGCLYMGLETEHVGSSLVQVCSLWSFFRTPTVSESLSLTVTPAPTATGTRTSTITPPGTRTDTFSSTATQSKTATIHTETASPAFPPTGTESASTTESRKGTSTQIRSETATAIRSETASVVETPAVEPSAPGNATSPVPTELNRTACAEQPGQHDRLVHIQPTPGSVPAAQAAADPMNIRVQLPSTATAGLGSSTSGSGGGNSTADVSWHPDVRQISGRVIAGPATISQNSTGMTRVSGSEVDLVLEINDGAALDEDATVTIEFTHGSFVWWTACPSTISQHVSVELTTLLGEPLPEAVRTSSKVVGTTGATVSVFTSGTGSLAMITSRASSIVAISACAFSHTAPLDFSLAPMGLEVGPARGAFYRGGILGNSLLLLISALAIGLVLAATHFGFKDEGWTSSCHRLHFPGILLLPYVLLVPGALSCCVAIVRHGVGPGDIALGVLGGLLWIVPALGCVIYFTTGRKFDCVFQGDKTVKAENQAAGITVGALEYHLLGLGHWKDKGRGFKYHWGVLFMDYCHERQWFVVVELIFTALCAVIEGFKPTTIRGCQYSLILYFALALLMLAVVLGCRPCVSTFNSLHMIGMAILLFVSTLLLLVGGLKGKGFEDVSEAGAYVAVFITYFSLIKSLVDIVATVQRRSRGLRNMLARRKKAARNNVALTLDASSQQQVLSVALLEEPILEEAEFVSPEQRGFGEEEMRSVGVTPSPIPSPPPEPEAPPIPVPQETVLVALLPTNQKKAAGPNRGVEGQQLYEEIQRGLRYGLHGGGGALQHAAATSGFQTANLHDLDLEDVLNGEELGDEDLDEDDDLLGEDILGDFPVPVPPTGDLSAEQQDLLSFL